jgi:hypothetical protein
MLAERRAYMEQQIKFVQNFCNKDRRYETILDTLALRGGRILPLVQQSNAGQGRLILEVYRSQTMTHHCR